MAKTRTERLLICAASLWLAIAAAWPASPSRPSSPTAAAPACSLEQVAVRTGDGVLLDGLLYRAAGKAGAKAILLVHGFGGNFYSGYFPAVAQSAASRGYACLALNMRDHDSGPKVSDFTDNQADIAAGLAYLRTLGHSRLVLLGQSMGTNRVLYYEAQSADPSLSATVLVSGPGNLFEWNARQFGQKPAQASVDDALSLQAAGRAEQLMLVDLGPLGKALYSARYLLSLRGPAARSDPYSNIQKVTTPILIVQGTADRLIEPEVGARLKGAATSSPRVDLVRLEGADHSFAKEEATLAHRVLAWLKEAAP